MIISNYYYITRQYNKKNLFKIKEKNTNERIYFGESNDLNNLYNKIKSEDFDINKVKKVFFDLNCTYPRYKLSNFTDIKRCLNPDKADIVVISKLNFNKYNNLGYLYYSKNNDCYYIIDQYNVNYYANAIRNIYKDSNTEISNLVLKYLIDNNMIDEDSTFIEIKKFVTISDKDEKSINIIRGGYKIVLDSDLDLAISTKLNNITESDIESINELLSSSDTNTVGLGLDLLINYNILDRACSVGMMLIKNNINILKSNKINSVGFKNILASLNLTKNNLIYYNENCKLHYINKLYKLANNEEDKDLAYKIATSIVKEQLEKSFKSMSDQITNLGIKIEIKVY